jgi:phage tail sheath gpL-like
MQGDQASVVAFGDLRNDRHTSYVATSDSPDLEAYTSVAMLASIRDAIETHGTPNISGQGERHPVPIRPFTVTHDSELLLQAGITPLRASGTTVTAVRFVASYREDTLGNEDLSQFDIGTVLSLIETGNRLKAEFQRHLGKAIVADGTPLSSIIAAVAISSEQLVGVVGEVLKGLWRDAILYGADEATIEQVVTSVTVLETGGRANGYQVVLDPTIVRRVIFLQALVRYL